MVVAFIVLSLAMIVGGLAAVVLGWDIVLVERGWAMVIAGSVIAGSGAVLLGLSAAIGRLGRIRSELSSLHEDLSRLGAPAPPLPVVDPVAAVSSGLLAGGAAGAASSGPSDREADATPELPSFLRPAEPGEDTPATAEPGLDRGRPAAAQEADRRIDDRDEDRLGVTADRSDGLRDSGADADGTELGARDKGALPPFEPEDQADLEPSSPDGADARPEPGAVEPEREREPEPEPEPDQRPTVIGTYNSGDNRYVMFSDGSIEAETPDGVFRFDSLDELKEFIASGGEGGSRVPR
jgi:hypothetical protein